MSKIHGTGTKHYMDQYVLCAVLNQVDIELSREVSDARTFCQNEKVPGFRQPSASFAGFGDFGTAASLAFEPGFDTLFRAGSEVSLLDLMGSAAGVVAFETYGILGKDTMAFSIADVVGQSGDIPEAKYISRGIAVNVETAITGTGAGTGQSHAITVATTDTFVATIRVTAVSGSGSVTFAIQESSDNGSGDAYATITSATGSGSSLVTTGAGVATFTGVGYARLTTTSATELWKRINATAFSGFTSVTVTVHVGVQAPV